MFSWRQTISMTPSVMTKKRIRSLSYERNEEIMRYESLLIISAHRREIKIFSLSIAPWRALSRTLTRRSRLFGRTHALCVRLIKQWRKRAHTIASKSIWWRRTRRRTDDRLLYSITARYRSQVTETKIDRFKRVGLLFSFGCYIVSTYRHDDGLYSLFSLVALPASSLCRCVPLSTAEY